MKYSEKLVFPEHSKTPEKRTTSTDVANNLKAVIVHEGKKIFQLTITSAISKGEKHGTIQVIPMYTNHQLLKQPASLHISYSMRNVQRKRCKRSGIFQRNPITPRCQRWKIMLYV